jgi:hypothetical protein
MKSIVITLSLMRKGVVWKTWVVQKVKNICLFIYFDSHKVVTLKGLIINYF